MGNTGCIDRIVDPIVRENEESEVESLISTDAQDYILWESKFAAISEQGGCVVINTWIPVRLYLFPRRLVWIKQTELKKMLPNLINHVVTNSENGIDIAPSCEITSSGNQLQLKWQSRNKVLRFTKSGELSALEGKLHEQKLSTGFFPKNSPLIQTLHQSNIIDKILSEAGSNVPRIALRTFFYKAHLSETKILREVVSKIVAIYEYSLVLKGSQNRLIDEDLFQFLANICSDPVYFLLFYIFEFEERFLNDFQTFRSDQRIDEVCFSVQEFIKTTISHTDWTVNRKFLLTLYEFPSDETESSWINMESTLTWISRIQTNNDLNGRLLSIRVNWETFYHLLTLPYFLVFYLVEAAATMRPSDAFYHALQTLTPEYFKEEVERNPRVLSLHSLFYNSNLSEPSDLFKLLTLFHAHAALTEEVIALHIKYSEHASKWSFNYFLNGLTYDYYPVSNEIRFSQVIPAVPNLLRVIVNYIKAINRDDPQAWRDVNVLELMKYIIRFEALQQDHRVTGRNRVFLLSNNLDDNLELKLLFSKIAPEMSTYVQQTAKALFNTNIGTDQIFPIVVSSDHEVVPLPEEIQKKENLEFFQNLVYGMIVIGLLLSSEPAEESINFLEFALQRLDLEHFEQLFGRGQRVRKMLFNYIVNTKPIVLNSSNNCEISYSKLDLLPLTRHEHFKPCVIEASMFITKTLPENFRSHLFSLGLHMQDFDKLLTHLQEINDSAQYNAELEKILMLMIPETLLRNGEEFVDAKFDLKTFLDCGIYATQATKVLRGFPNAQKKLLEVIPKYLKEFSLKSLPALFKALESLAFFVKYLDKENIKKAYLKFHERNQHNSVLEHYLQTVEENFDKPLVQNTDLALADENAIKTLIDCLLNDKTPNKIPEMNLLRHIAAHWIRNRKDLVGMCMPPRNSQVITVLIIVQWLKERLLFTNSGKVSTYKFKSLLAEIGTGEGKSLIIAMISILLAKRMGKKVHILVNNVSLLERDYATFKEFYDQFGLTCKESTSNSDFDANIIYCTRPALLNFYRERISKKGIKPFENTILIVDEVDSLTLDENPEESFVDEDSEYNLYLIEYFKELQNPSRKRLSMISYPTIWKEAQDAIKEAEKKEEGFGVKNGYSFHEGNYYMHDSKGHQLFNHYSLWLEYIRFSKLSNYTPRYCSIFYVQSLIYMLNQYEAIVGLSGSLGSEEEKKFLQEMYNPWFFSVPPFLDTCNGAAKQIPALIDKCVYCYQNENQQFEKICESVQRLTPNVPVLIVAQNPQMVQKIFDELPVPDEAKQIFLEIDQNGKKMNWSKIVELATKPCSTVAGYRVTVTDYWGGRGQDYQINDDRVNLFGGLAVIITTIPDSTREWIQWIGRTCRNDNNGQLLVVLNQAADEFSNVVDDVFAEQRSEVDDSKYKPYLIQVLLAEGDRKIKADIERKARNRKRGILLNELCDDFYYRYRRGNDWPVDERSKALRNLLEKRDDVLNIEEEVLSFRGKYL